MNKAELIDLVSGKTNFPKSQSETVLNAALEAIEAAVARGEEVKLVGFGTFDRASRKERRGRNPKTGETLTIPAAHVPRFRPGKDFKTLVKTK